MMNDDMLRNIEYLREKADVSYQEAADLLERYDGNVMRVLVELEQQGRVYAHPGNVQTDNRQQRQNEKNEARERANSVINKAFRRRLVVEKKGENGKKVTYMNLSVPVAVGAAVVAPYLALAGVAATFVSGSRIRLRTSETDAKVPEDVESFVDKTVSNIKETASSLGQICKDKEDEQSGDE